ncbi:MULTISPECIES: DUF2127 domain-containing protein [Clostridium]|uniref:DUF2127 domain-containing protein n=1 Tax=Clostridium TaxID=1485 RepID=UPI0008245E30|nr:MULTISPECIES: DUF2127 domain-containing protein [Clostridium]PJI10495.1 DUF2127 domain-containing protein [Clostridium sp. CT7]
MSGSKKINANSSIFHKGFELGILIKAIDSILEIIGGVLLVFLNPSRLNNLVIWLTQHELSEDPRDVIANFMIKLSSKFTINTQYFGVFYLVSHGIVKLILIIFLWKGKTWAYPVTIVSLIVFIMYQIYRYMLNPSMGLVLLTIFDFIMIILTFIEYRRVKN